MSICKSSYTVRSMEIIRTIIARMGWKTDEDDDFIYVLSVSKEDRDIFDFIFDF